MLLRHHLWQVGIGLSEDVLLQLLLHLLLLVKVNGHMQVSELTQQLQLTQKLREKRSLQERQAVPAAKNSQVGCSQALSRCSMDSGSTEGFAWRRLPPRNASGSPQGRKGQSNATAAASGSKGHKLAVLVPYRDRPSQLDTMLPALDAYLQVGHLFSLLLKLSLPNCTKWCSASILCVDLRLISSSCASRKPFADRLLSDTSRWIR